MNVSRGVCSENFIIPASSVWFKPIGIFSLGVILSSFVLFLFSDAFCFVNGFVSLERFYLAIICLEDARGDWGRSFDFTAPYFLLKLKIA